MLAIELATNLERLSMMWSIGTITNCSIYFKLQKTYLLYSYDIKRCILFYLSANRNEIRCFLHTVMNCIQNLKDKNLGILLMLFFVTCIRLSNKMQEFLACFSLNKAGEQSSLAKCVACEQLAYELGNYQIRDSMLFGMSIYEP